MSYCLILVSFLRSSSFAELAIANSIWVRDSHKVKDKPQRIFKNSFDMQSYPLKTAQAVNDWVYLNTKGKIEKIVEGIPEDVKLGKIAVIFFTNTSHNLLPFILPMERRRRS
jgi:serine protease inhibitor